MANISRYNPMSEVVTLRDAMDQLVQESFISPFSRMMNRSSAASNLYETADAFILQIPVPGVSPDAIEVNVHADKVNLKWSTNMKAPEGATVHWQAFGESEYQQSFTLPMQINPEHVGANVEQGVLILTLPKAEQAKSRVIKVNS